MTKLWLYYKGPMMLEENSRLLIPPNHAKKQRESVYLKGLSSPGSSEDSVASNTPLRTVQYSHKS